MVRHVSSAPAMTLYQHWVADCTVRHQKAVRLARALGPAGPGGRTPNELTQATIDLIDRLHSLDDLVRAHGVDEVFGPREQPMTSEERRKLLR